ncbi:MAG TPA: hypothetical protein P5335_00165 [Flavobacterium sp.]|nr:hypothetical protein [Flavobacterium sp.]
MREKEQIVFLSIPQSQGSPKLSVQKLTFRVVGIDAVFFEIMPTAKFQSEWKTSGII